MKISKYLLFTGIFISLLFYQCSTAGSGGKKNIQTGASRMLEYIPSIEDKSIAVVANHTSLVNNTHLVDTLLSQEIDLKKIFSPEHGFRGTASAGEKLNNHIDTATGLPVISLYGSARKPAAKDLAGIDRVIFDIQDVGVRFYTYISTLHYVMEACAEEDIPVMVLDRPNPNGFFIDGPVLKKEYRSFVGMHPIPLVHGMTMGEIARMINGEKWLKDSLKCRLTVIPCKGYKHTDTYQLPVKPSPNLPNMKSVYLYPSLGLFEGTIMSIGRGTANPFQVIGHPEYPDKDFYFIPESNEGAKNPKYEGNQCYGINLSHYSDSQIVAQKSININWLINTYQTFSVDQDFFNNFFNLLAGTDKLKKQIKEGKSESEIRQSWQKELHKFYQKRKKYLLYPDIPQPY